MIAHVVYSFWAVAFALGLLSHDVWFTLGMGYLISNFVVWPSDHAMDPITIANYFHLAWTGATLVGGLIGVLAASATKMPRLLYTEQLFGGRWSSSRAWMLTMLMSVIAVSAGINFVTCRPCVGGAGMSPMNLDDTASYVLGGVLLAVGGVLLIASIVMLWRGDWRGALGVKYFIPLVLIPSGLLFLHDYLAITNPIGNWEPGVIYLASLIIAAVLLWLYVYYVPAPGEASAADEFYRRSMNSTILVAVYAVTLFVGGLSVFIPIWILDYNALLEALISASAVSLAAIIILVVLTYMAQDEATTWTVVRRNEPMPLENEADRSYSDGVVNTPLVGIRNRGLNTVDTLENYV